MAKKQMSIWSKEVKGAMIPRLDEFGFTQTYNYIPMTEKEYWDFVRKDSKELDKWNRIFSSGFISTLDICRASLNPGQLRYVKAFELGGRRSFVEEKLKNAGYYCYKDRNIYKDGSTFWKLDEIEHVFDGIHARIESFIEYLTPKQTFWNGKLLCVWHRYSGVMLFVEEVRLEKKMHDERNKKAQDERIYRSREYGGVDDE